MPDYVERKLGKYHLLFVEKSPCTYYMYVGLDGKRYCHYDAGGFNSLNEAANVGTRFFDPAPFELFPFTSITREEVLTRAPHAFDKNRGGA